MKDGLLDNIEKIHTTNLGIERITNNIKYEGDDVVEYCKMLISRQDANILRKGKNWYVYVENIEITVNAYSYTIITAHISKNEK